MPKYQCICGAKYKFPDSAVGKKAKCKQCDAVFTLAQDDDAPIAIADEPVSTRWNLEDEIAQATQRGREAAPPAAAVAVAVAAQPLTRAGRNSMRSFLDSVVTTILFPANVTNLIMFFAIWIGLTIGAMLPCFASSLVSLWYAAFRFAVIESAAGGDKKLPEVEFSRDALSEAFFDSFRWLGSWVAVLLPAIVYFIAMSMSGSTEVLDTASALAGGISGFLPGSGGDPLHHAGGRRTVLLARLRARDPVGRIRMPPAL